MEIDTGFISTTEAAQRYGFNRRYLAEMCRKGRFGTAFQVPGKFKKQEWHIYEEELEQYRGLTKRGPYARKIRRVIRVIPMF